MFLSTFSKSLCGNAYSCHRDPIFQFLEKFFFVGNMTVILSKL